MVSAVPPPDDGPTTNDTTDDDPWRLSRRTMTWSVSVGVAVGLFALAFLMPVPYVTLRPGPTFNTLGEFDGEAMLTFGEDVTVHPADGKLDFTTVAMTRAESTVTFAAALKAWMDPDVHVLPHDFVYAEGETNEESSQSSAAQLSNSKDESKAAGLRAAGFTVPERAVVAQVSADAPADGKLRVDDQIVEVDGTEVASVGQAGELIAEREPGDSVDVTVRRGGRDVEATVGTVEDPDSGRPRIGIWIRTEYDFPVEVGNHVGDSIGGPSAGAMFALAIYDKLTPGDLTGGRHFAGTGTISGDGSIGQISGIRQKIAGARDGGATFFLVPEANCADLDTESIDGIRLFSAAQLDDAIDSIETLAEDPEAQVPTCPT